MSFRRLLAIIKKEIVHVKRDKPSLIMAFAAPIIMIMLFGYAVNTDVNNIKTAVLDMDKTQMSKSMIDTFNNSNYFQVTSYASSMDELTKDIQKGTVKAGLVINSNFQADLKRNLKPEVLFLIDGSDPSIAKTAYASGIMTLQSFSSNISLKKNIMLQGKNIKEAISIKGKTLYNPQHKSTNFTIPGLIGLIMQNITIMLTAFALVREKEKGTIEQLIVTPVKRFELILGKLIPYTVIGFMDFLAATFFGTWWFGVPINGSIPLLIIMGLGFVFCALSMGILISTVSQNQLQAMQMSILIILPSVLLSGFIFPRETMPIFIRALGDVIPLTYFLVILRGIILKGTALSLISNEVAILFCIGLTLFILSILRFRKKLD